MSDLKDEREAVVLNEIEQYDTLRKVHEDMESLVLKANNVQVSINDKKSYDDAILLKKEIKATHIAIEKKRQDLKSPIIKMGKDLDAFAKKLYEPLKMAETLVKDKCTDYEAEQERLKKEKKNKLEAERKAEDELNDRLKDLNGYLEKINNAKTVSEIDDISSYLSEIDLKSFGDKSGDAGFIVTQLKMTCKMAGNFIASQPKPIVEKSTPVPSDDKKETKDTVEGNNIVVPTREVNKSESKAVNAPIHHQQPTESIPDKSRHHSPFSGELDFSKVADENALPIENEIIEEVNPKNETVFGKPIYEFEGMDKMDEKVFSKEAVDVYLKMGVLPSAIYCGENEENVIEVQFVNSVTLKDKEGENTETHGLPKSLTVMSVKANGEELIGSYIFKEINQ